MARLPDESDESDAVSSVTLPSDSDTEQQQPSAGTSVTPFHGAAPLVKDGLPCGASLSRTMDAALADDSDDDFSKNVEAALASDAADRPLKRAKVAGESRRAAEYVASVVADTIHSGEAASSADAFEERDITKRMQEQDVYAWLTSCAPFFKTNSAHVHAPTLQHAKPIGASNQTRWKLMSFAGEGVKAVIDKVRLENDEECLHSFLQTVGLSRESYEGYLVSVRGDCPEIWAVIQSSQVKRWSPRAGDIVIEQFTIASRGGLSPDAKVLATIRTIVQDSFAYAANMKEARTAVVTEYEIVEPEQLRASVKGWSKAKLRDLYCKIGDKIRVFGKDSLDNYERAMVVPATKQMLFEHIETQGQTRSVLFDILDQNWRSVECPGQYSVDATEYFKHEMQLVRYNNIRQRVEFTTVDRWLQGAAHRREAMLLIGPPEIGKSTATKLVAQEITAGQYEEGNKKLLNMKSLDSFGLLSHAGVFDGVACIMVHDVEWKASRGKSLGAQALKAFFQQTETCQMDDCRYKVGEIPTHISRIMGINPGKDGVGTTFRRADLDGFADYLETIARQDSEAASSYQHRLHNTPTLATLNRDDSDTSAIARRVWVGFASENLVSDAMVERLKAVHEVAAVQVRERRQSFWAQHPRQDA